MEIRLIPHNSKKLHRLAFFMTPGGWNQETFALHLQCVCLRSLILKFLHIFPLCLYEYNNSLQRLSMGEVAGKMELFLVREACVIFNIS